MPTVHPTSRAPGRAWIGVLGLVAVAAAALWWWPGPHTADADAAAAASASAAAASRADTRPAPSSPPQEGFDARLVKAQQEEAAREIQRQPDLGPVKGPVTERPPFVSHLEWLMLKGVAQQHPSPDKELTRLVNALRFNKQLELWEGLAPSDQAHRQPLALRLLDELPQRVVNGEMGLNEAQSTQKRLLKDAVPDTAARERRAAAEAGRLKAAQEAWLAANPPDKAGSRP